MNGLPDPRIEIGTRRIGGDNPCFVIAEIGTEHAGDPVQAGELVDAAAEGGADCVKTQVVFADEILHPKAGLVNLPGGKISLYQRFRDLEQTEEFFRTIKERAERKNMVFLCTPFGEKSAGIVRSLRVEAVKIASPELNHYPLLSAASFGVPLILSTGVSTLGDIEAALAAVPGPKALLQCVTAYPAPPEDYNLRCVQNLSRIFGVPVGVSDHTADPYSVPLTAVAYGASLLEKHITLQRDGKGLDQPFALTPEDFAGMTGGIRGMEELSEEDRRLCALERFGEATVATLLGDGVKRLSPAERENYRTTNRSILAIADLPAGTELTRHNTALLRSEKNLRPGLNPEEWPNILGKHLVRDVRAGNGITWPDLIQ